MIANKKLYLRLIALFGIGNSIQGSVQRIPNTFAVVNRTSELIQVKLTYEPKQPRSGLACPTFLKDVVSAGIEQFSPAEKEGKCYLSTIDSWILKSDGTKEPFSPIYLDPDSGTWTIIFFHESGRYIREYEFGLV